MAKIILSIDFPTRPTGTWSIFSLGHSINRMPGGPEMRHSSRGQVSFCESYEINNAISGMISGGTLRSHPHFASSDASFLPLDKNEVARLYTESVPARLKRFVQLRIFEHGQLPTIDGKLAGRCAPQDENTERKTSEALKLGIIRPDRHMVIFDTGGAHSIAAARALAKAGYIIIPHFNHTPASTGEEYFQIALEEDGGALSYFAKEIAQLNRMNSAKLPQAPWALISDTHQNDGLGKPVYFENDIPLIPDGFGVIYVDEGNKPLTRYEGQCRHEKHSLEVVKRRGVADLFTLGLCPYEYAMPFGEPISLFQKSF